MVTVAQPVYQAARRRKKLSSSHYLLLALLFFAGLELITVFHQWMLAWILGLFGVLAYGIVLIRMEERHKFFWHQIILPLLAVIGLVGMVLFLPRTPLLHLYYALAALLFFLTLKHGARQAYPTWNWFLSVIVFFLNTAVITGLHYQLYTIPMTVVTAMIFLLGFLLSFQGWRRLFPGAAVAALVSMAVGLALSELAWVLSFLPAHFFMRAGVVVCVYYAFFHILCLSQERKLHLRDMIEYGFVSAAALLILIVSSDWT